MNKLRRDKLKQRKAAAFLLVLSLFVSTGVVWELHLTGITLAGDAYCGLEEHTHTEECIERTLICGYTETEAVPEQEDSQPDQTIEIVESEQTFEEESAEVMEAAEQEDIQTEQPAEAGEEELSSGEEIAADEENTDDPADETEAEVIPTHIHTDECYEITYICGKEEHIHTLECYPDSAADVENAEDWESTLPQKLSGDPVQDLMAVAISQIGYTESEENYKVDENGIKHGYTRYGQWYGNPYGDWNAMFAVFCLNYAGIIPNEDMPAASGCSSWVVQLKNEGLYLAIADMEEDEYMIGNLLFLDEDLDGVVDRVGIVIQATDETITVIEGDLDNAVAIAEYALEDERIDGYGFLPMDFFSIAAIADTDESTGIHIRKVWSDGENHEEDPVTVDITDESGDIVQTVTMTYANNWEMMVPGLASDVTYTVTERPISGYVSSAAPEVYVEMSYHEATSLESGKTYLITYASGSNTYAVANASGQTLSRGDVVMSEGLPDAASIDSSMLWTYQSNGYLQNNGTDNYLYASGRSWSTSSSNGRSISYSNGKLSYRSTMTTAYLSGYNGYTTNAGSATTYTLYEVSQSSMPGFVIQNQKIYVLSEEDTEETDLSFPHSKPIDAFRDGEDNPDTTLDTDAADTTDLYRLYLDVTGKEPVNVLFVFDFSGSMYTTDSGYAMDGQTRYDVMLGTLADMYSETIIDDICQNADNMVSFATFSSCEEGHRAETTGSWTNDADTFKAELNAATKPTWATNYERGLELAKGQLAALFAAHPEREYYKTHLVFVGDGAATEYIADVTYNGVYFNHLPQEHDYYNATSQYPYFYVNGEDWTTNTTHNVPTGYVEVTSRVETAEVINFVFPHTSRYITQFQADYPNLIIDTIAFSSVDMDAYIDGTDYQYSSLLKQMPQNGGAYHKAGSASELESLLDRILTLRGTNLVISDELSDYVDLYEAQPDIKVTLTSTITGDVITLYDGAMTEDAAGILQDVVVEGKTIKAVFYPDYVISSLYKITLSFNVQTTQTAYQEYIENGYTYSGDWGTDYGSNATSSNEPGFYSNNQASIFYYRGGQYWEESYDKPVIQAETNQTGARFPETGGSGIFPYTIGGILLIAIPLLVGCGRCRRRRRCIE